MARRRTANRLPRGVSLVAAGVLAFGCGKKKDEETKVEPPQPVAADAAKAVPPQVAPGSVPDNPVIDGGAAAATPDASGPVKRTLDNLPGKLKPVPEDRRVKKDREPADKPKLPQP